jgi:IPT/TIG domain
MRLKAWGTMVVLLVALVGATACSSDSPTPTQPTGGGTGGGTTGSGGVTLTLVASNTKPKAGTCALVQASVLFNGQAVPDGTSVVFSTDFGFFGDSGLNIVSLLTQQSAAFATLCSDNEGTANVTARVTYKNKNGQAAIAVTFGAGVTTGPFISFCTPSIGPVEGGTAVTINGGNFDLSGAASLQVSVVFSSKDGTIQLPATVTGNSATAITLLTPAYPKPAASPIPVDVTISLRAGVVSATVTATSCFTYFGSSVVPQIFSLLPSSGSNLGGTRVTILGSGFQAPVQVFFGDAPNQTEAVVVSVSFSQIVILTPAAFGAGQGNLNQSVSVTVKDAGAGADVSAKLSDAFRYVTAMQANGVSPLVGAPGTLFTIFGNGFSAPLLATVGGTQLPVISISATEVVVRAPAGACLSLSGAITLTNLNTGEFVTTPQSISVQTLSITSAVPATGPSTGGTSVTIAGSQLFPPASPGSASVTVAGVPATITSTTTSPDGSSQTLKFATPVNTIPMTACTLPAQVVVTNGATGCSVSTSFVYSATSAGTLGVTQVNGVGGSMQVTFNLTGQGGPNGPPATSAVIDFGDGTSPQTVALTQSGTASSGSVVHVYGASGPPSPGAGACGVGFAQIVSWTNSCAGAASGGPSACIPVSAP